MQLYALSLIYSRFCIDILHGMTVQLDALHIDPTWLDRSVNEGFSGGERKRNEVLQLAVLEVCPTSHFDAVAEIKDGSIFNRRMCIPAYEKTVQTQISDSIVGVRQTSLTFLELHGSSARLVA